MKNSQKINDLQGSIVALVTPFTKELLVDYKALEELINWHITSGTNALVICGTTGETPTLTHSEYLDVIAFSVKIANERVPVIGGAGTNATQSTIENCRELEKLGVDGLLIVCPYYNKPTTEGIFRHFKQVAEATNLPVIVYNVPGRSGKNIPANLILRLSTITNIMGVKEASGDVGQIMEILSNRSPNFRVYLGDDFLALPIIAMGADGCISVVANQIPEQFSKMINLALLNNMDEALEIHNKYLKLMNLNFIESNPIPVKTSLASMGKITEMFRLPLCEMESSNKEILLSELKKLKLI